MLDFDSITFTNFITLNKRPWQESSMTATEKEHFGFTFPFIYYFLNELRIHHIYVGEKNSIVDAIRMGKYRVAAHHYLKYLTREHVTGLDEEKAIKDALNDRFSRMLHFGELTEAQYNTCVTYCNMGRPYYAYKTMEKYKSAS